MNILVFVKLYMHKNKSGGEAYLHHFLKRLQTERDVKIRVILPECKEMKKIDFEGIEINETSETTTDCLQYIDTCDLLITQLDFAKQSLDYALKISKPCMMLFHNSIDHYDKFIEDPKVIKIFNSNYVMNEYIQRDLIPNNHYLIYPYTDFPKLSKFKKKIDDRLYITLVNPSLNKGANIVVELARKFKDKKFLIVKGGYYNHEQKPFLDIFKTLPNVHIINNTPNIIDDIYLKSKIVIQPSIYETYGMVASEACCLGIPVIINRTSKGLIENMGKMCLGGYDKNILSYEKVIESLDIIENYHIWSNYYFDVAQERYHEIEYQINKFINDVFPKI